MDFSERFNEANGHMSALLKLVERVSARAVGGAQDAKDALRAAGMQVAQQNITGAITTLSSALGMLPVKKSLSSWANSIVGPDFTLPKDPGDGGIVAWADSALQKASAYSEAALAASARNALHYKLYSIVRSYGPAGAVTPADIDSAVAQAADDVLLHGSINFIDELRKFVNEKGYQGLKDLIRSRVPDVIQQIESEMKLDRGDEAKAHPYSPNGF